MARANTTQLLLGLTIICLCLKMVVGQLPHMADSRKFPTESRTPDLKGFFESKGLDYDKVISLLENEDELMSLLQKASSDIFKRPELLANQNGDSFFSIQRDRLVSERCAADWLTYLSDIVDGVLYARRMWKSFGHLPDETSFYTFLFKDYGNSWLCQDNKPNATGYPPFSGQFCATYLTTQIQVGWGSCFPSTCSQWEIQAISDAIWKLLLNVDVPFMYYECMGPEQWGAADISVLVVLCLFTAMVAVGSLYEVFLHKRVVKTAVVHVEPAVEPNHYEDIDKVKETSMSVGENGEDVPGTSENSSQVNEGYENHEKGEMGEIKKDLGLYTEEANATKSCETEAVTVNKPLVILDGFLMSFSAVTNCRKLLSAKKTKNTMAALNGLRVISMFWVILGHSMQFFVGRYNNPAEILQLIGYMGFNAIFNATVSVDTFFVLSGFLVTYLTLKQMDKSNGKLNWALYYFHRWWRLTPVYMAAMAIWALLFPHFGQGILTDDLYWFIKHQCRISWWTHPLYINNLYPWPNVIDNSCMGWSWYLANDMQFYIISPLILIVLYKNTKAGMALIGAIMTISLSSLFGINWYYGYPINGQDPYNDHQSNLEVPNQDTTYGLPYTRIPTYLVGMIAGYIMFSLKGKRMRLPKWVVIVGWICALGTLFAVVYGTWASHDRRAAQIEAVAYLTFHRVAWGVGIVWIILACLNGYGGPVGVLLDWGFWIPLARLTYCAYLVHPIIIFSTVLSNKQLFHFDYISISYFYVGNIVFSYVSALILSLIMEGPFMGLEKVMFGKYKPS